MCVLLVHNKWYIGIGGVYHAAYMMTMMMMMMMMMMIMMMTMMISMCVTIGAEPVVLAWRPQCK